MKSAISAMTEITNYLFDNNLVHSYADNNDVIVSIKKHTKKTYIKPVDRLLQDLINAYPNHRTMLDILNASLPIQPTTPVQEPTPTPDFSSLSPIIHEALQSDTSSDQPMIANEGLDWLETLLKKNKDYGSSVFKAPILTPNLSTASAILVRMSDKISRLNNLLTTNSTPEINESIEDTIKDLGAYCLLYLCSLKHNKQHP